ncbi:MAG: Diguanylate cyclase [Microgenomates group bacterium GW2011_GWA2_40_6]|nr:MAG: Diguanylate cyclase [Microgenomates group bacterium GW2011_GWA2_40_6]
MSRPELTADDISQQKVLMEQFPGPVALVSRQGKVLGGNGRFGCDFGIIPGQEVSALLGPEINTLALAKWTLRSARGESGGLAPVFRIGDRDVRFQARWIGEEQALMVAVENVTSIVKSGKLNIEILMNFPNVVVVKSEGTDGQPVTEFVNPKIEELLGYTPDEWTGNPKLHHQIIMAKDRVRVGKEVIQARENETQVILEYRAIRKDEKKIWIRHIVNFFRDFETGKLYSIESLRDISREKALSRKLEKLSVTDSLTGLPNRRKILRFLKEAIQISRRTKTSLSILFMDIDKFKEINDKIDYPTGDKRLKAITKLLKQFVRRRFDILGRYGGEEFVFVLLATDRDGALLLAEMIRAEAEAAIAKADPKLLLGSLTEDGFMPGFTLSIGVATFTLNSETDASTLDKLLKAANWAEKKAKEQGRNRVCGTEKV